jgi:hypothetical protein
MMHSHTYANIAQWLGPKRELNVNSLKILLFISVAKSDQGAGVT